MLFVDPDGNFASFCAPAFIAQEVISHSCILIPAMQSLFREFSHSSSNCTMIIIISRIVLKHTQVKNALDSAINNFCGKFGFKSLLRMVNSVNDDLVYCLNLLFSRYYDIIIS